MSGSGGQGSNGGTEKDKDLQWYFTAEQLSNSPSRRHGIDSDQELSYRQMTAYLIQEMGQRLQVSQLCINTAIVYMHRFYAFHSFTHFHRNGIAAASLFLAAKVEEQPRKLEHVIKAANKCLFQPTSSTTDAYYIEQAQDLVFNENVLLQTLGFDVAIDHPHTHVVKTCHLVKACKDLAQTSYFLASNSLHLTSMCLQYKPTVVACFCIYLACKWSRWEIPQSTEGKHWFHYVDKSVTMDLLKQLTDEFIAIYEKSPARLKSKLNSIKALAQGASTRVLNKDKKVPAEEWKMGDMMKMYHSSINTSNDGNSNSSSSSTQAISYSMQASSEPQQQQSQSVATALLPPPPPQTQQQQQQMRKSEMHSSQHRAHHNSSSHHHTKLPYSSSGDAPDHKLGHKQQTAFSGNIMNRSRDHSQASQSHPVMLSGSVVQSRSGTSSSSGRSSIGGSGGMPSQQASQRQSTQSHQLDVTYHKSRERSNLLGVPVIHGAPSHTGHKIPQKQHESGRVTSKDALSRMPEQAKQDASKIFSSVSSMGSIPQFGGSQMQSSSQSNTKTDQGHDLSRSMLHNQRPYGGSQSQPTVPPTLGYHQTQLPRQGNSNNKHDQSKVLSVHMQQQQQLQQHHKQSVPAETNYGAITHEPLLQHSHQPHATTAGFANMRPAEIQHAEDHSSSQFSAAHGVMPPTQMQLSQPQAKAASSMFSPDWNDKLQNQNTLMGGNYNGNNMGAVLNDSFGFKMTSSNMKESPRRSDRETIVKKEKSRNSHMATENAPITTARSSVQQQLKASMPKKLDSSTSASMSASLSASSNLSELAGTSISGAVGGGMPVKRSSDFIAFKQEDDVLRDSKMRRLDNTASLAYIDTKSVGDLNKLQVVNGIETNPDLVRSLLKESLCTTSGLLKPESLIEPSHLPPAELLEPTSTAVTFKSGTDASAVEKTAMEIDDLLGVKAEKKKKKDKHKHKEKDKSKDRDERKKHKKDKERHKEREREPENSEHVKIKISKEKLEASSGPGEPPPVGFKIKIPKDRIIGDIHSSASGYTQGSTQADHSTGAVPPTPALKIKISKDKLENYSSGSTEPMGVSQLAHTAQSSAGYYASFGAHNTMPTSHGGSSSNNGGSNGKKKDRDRDKEREREKEKKRSAHDFVKSNGSTSASAAAVGVGGGVMPGHMAANTPLQKPTQNSSKMQQHFTNKVSQLFGESNDDDDDDDDDNDDDSFRNYASNALSSSLSSSLMSTSQAPTQAFRQNTEFGMRNTEPSQHLGQHQIPQR